MRILPCLAFITFTLTAGAHADAVEDALEAASSAYAAGDLSGTAAHITAASRAVLELQSAKLRNMLPEAPSGWSREVADGEDGGMMLAGIVGNTVSARYSKGDDSFTLTLTADSPMVAQMSGMLGNLQMMSMMGKIRKISGQDMLEQDRALSALVGGRVLLQAEGMDSSEMQEVLEQMDFSRLPAYDS